MFDKGNCWHDAAVAVMGIAPELSWTQQMGLHSIGLSEVVALFKSSKEIRRKMQLRAPVLLSQEQQQQIDAAMDEISEVGAFSLVLFFSYFLLSFGRSSRCP